jgi:hypothetical protein
MHMRKGALIIMAVLIVALLVSEVSAFAGAGTWNQANALGAGGRHASASSITGQITFATDSNGIPGRDTAATAGFAAARARGEISTADCLSVGIALAW